MSEKVSILMSTYNEPIDWVIESVNSILNQTYKDIELIIVIDNPNNIEVINYVSNINKKYNFVQLIINDKNIGLVNSLNKAISVATGTYIARMDADDISELDRIDRQIIYLKKYNLDFIFSGLSVIDENSRELYTTDLDELSQKSVKEILKVTNISNHPTWLVKKDVYDDLGGYRSVLHTEDYDFSLRAINKGYQIGKMPGFILRYRVRSGSVSRTFSLIQYLNSQVLVDAIKHGKLEDESFIFERINQATEIATNKEIDNFKKSEEYFLSGVNKVKNKKMITGITEIARAITISKHFRKKTFQIFEYKIKKKLNQ